MLLYIYFLLGFESLIEWTDDLKEKAEERQEEQKEEREREIHKWIVNWSHVYKGGIKSCETTLWQER